MSTLPTVERFMSSTGVQIYRIPVEAFPGFIAYTYVILGAGVPTLIDCGSGIGSSDEQLAAGIAHLREAFGEKVTFGDIERILITHGHIDHFGGVAAAKEQAKASAQIAIYPLDQRILVAYQERVAIATKDLNVYLERAGVKEPLRGSLLTMYGFAKQHFRSVAVDFALEDGLELDGMRFYHTPGHCSGQVCILIGDVLISADHILARITPHQAPESITRYTGLGHYFEALDKIAKVDGIRLALGGHESPIEDVYGRIEEIRASHERKLERVLDSLREAGQSLTISDMSKVMYPNKGGYDVLLALEEVGAHVEYLYEHGALAVTNIDELEREPNPALQYRLT